MQKRRALEVRAVRKEGGNGYLPFCTAFFPKIWSHNWAITFPITMSSQMAPETAAPITALTATAEAVTVMPYSGWIPLSSGILSASPHGSTCMQMILPMQNDMETIDDKTAMTIRGIFFTMCFFPFATIIQSWQVFVVFVD